MQNNSLAHVHPFKSWFVWGIGAAFFFSMYIVRVSNGVILEDLMKEFAVTATSVSYIASFFYLGYVSMQVPAGILLDKFGTRRLLTLMVAVSGLSTMMFAHATQIEHTYFLRLCFGLSAAFGFVGALKLATAWFEPKRLGLVFGITQGLGMLGGMFGQGPFAMAVQNYGWRDALSACGGWLILLAGIIFLFVRNSPNEKSSPATNVAATTTTEERPKHYFRNVLLNKQTWIVAIYAGLIFAPVEIFGELWGATYLRTVNGITHQQAADCISFLFVGLFVGHPLGGWISDRLGRRPVMILSAMIGTVIAVTLLATTELDTLTLEALMLAFGLTNGGLIAAYTAAGEIHPQHSTGLSLGFVNMMSVIIGAAMQPLIGLMVDFYWDGRYFEGTPLYTANEFKQAMMVLPLCTGIAILLSFFYKETLKK